LGAWMFVCCECYVLSGRGLCVKLITCLEESYWLVCCVWSRNLNEEAMTCVGSHRHTHTLTNQQTNLKGIVPKLPRKCDYYEQCFLPHCNTMLIKWQKHVYVDSVLMQVTSKQNLWSYHRLR
jgi:hypothetical protein